MTAKVEFGIAGICKTAILEAVKTTIGIPEETLRSTMRFTGAKTKKDAVVMALEEFNREQRIRELVATFGTWDISTNEEIEAGDVAEMSAKSFAKANRTQIKR